MTGIFLVGACWAITWIVITSWYPDRYTIARAVRWLLSRPRRH